MAVKIKLKRLGKIRAPYYRIVVADARTKRDGRAIEEIGKYHPKAEPSFIEVNSERAQHWLSVGAQPTDPVRKILEITGDWQKFKGLPGAEGTLRMAAPKEDRKEIFAAAAKESLGDVTSAPKGKARAKSADAKTADAKTADAKSGDAKAATPSRQARMRARPRRRMPSRATLAKAKADKPADARQAVARRWQGKPGQGKRRRRREARPRKGSPAKADKPASPAKAAAAADEAKAADKPAKPADKAPKAADAPAAAEPKAAVAAEAAPAEAATPLRPRPAKPRPLRPRPRLPQRRMRLLTPPRRRRPAEADVLEEALEHLVKGIVEYPDDVQVGSRGLRRGRVLEVRVHPEDLGKVIGRGGRTAKALGRSSARWRATPTSGLTCWTPTRSASRACNWSLAAWAGRTGFAGMSPSRCGPTTLSRDSRRAPSW